MQPLLTSMLSPDLDRRPSAGALVSSFAILRLTLPHGKLRKRLAVRDLDVQTMVNIQYVNSGAMDVTTKKKWRRTKDSGVEKSRWSVEEDLRATQMASNLDQQLKSGILDSGGEEGEKSWIRMRKDVRHWFLTVGRVVSGTPVVPDA
jgi:hypothetical protein